MYYVNDWHSGVRYAMDAGKFYYTDTAGMLKQTDNTCLLLPCMQHLLQTGCISLLFSANVCEYAVYTQTELIRKESTDANELRRILTVASATDACIDVLVRRVDNNVTQRIIVLDTALCKIERASEGWEKIFVKF